MWLFSVELTSCLLCSVLPELSSLTCPHGSRPRGCLSASCGQCSVRRWGVSCQPPMAPEGQPLRPPAVWAPSPRASAAWRSLGGARRPISVRPVRPAVSGHGWRLTRAGWVSRQVSGSEGRPDRWHLARSFSAASGVRPVSPVPAAGPGVWPVLWARGRFPPALQVLGPRGPFAWSRNRRPGPSVHSPFPACHPARPLALGPEGRPQGSLPA